MTLQMYLILALLGGGLGYFLTLWYQSLKVYQAMNRTDQREANYADEERKRNAGSIQNRLKAFLVKRGYRGDFTPAAVAVLFAYMVSIAILRIVGIQGILSVVIALPVALGLCYLSLTMMAAKRRRAFAQQLMLMLSLLATQIESGLGSRRALSVVVPNLANPLREEMSMVLAQVSAGRDLVESLRVLSLKYPSRAMTMFISTMEIDKDHGTKVAPALRQASDILQADFALASEAAAELSQAKGEFYGIIGIVGAILFVMLSGGGDLAKEAYFSTFGILGLGFGFVNFALGIYRALRMFNDIKAG